MPDGEAIASIVRTAKPDVCIHLAAVSAVAAAERAPEHAWQVNVQGTMQLAWALLKYAPGCQLLFVSSADAYGTSFEHSRSLDETAPLSPMSVYAQTKATADLAMRGLADQGLRVVRLRPFNHTGTGQSPSFVVAAFARQIARIAIGRQAPVLRVGNLETWRDFLDVRDVCIGYVQCIEHRDQLQPGIAINLASGQPRRIGDILNSLATMADVVVDVEIDKTRLRSNDLIVASGSSQRAHAILEWTPMIPWDKTLQDVLEDWGRRAHFEVDAN